MKFYSLFFIVLNAFLVSCGTERNLTQECNNLANFLKTGGYELQEDCCNDPNIECKNSAVNSIDLTLDSGILDFSLLPEFYELDKYSIKGDVYQGKFPVELFTRNIRVIDIPNSNIASIPCQNGLVCEEYPDRFSDTVEEIYLNNNKLTTFPYILSKFSKMKILNLDNNRISGSFTVDFPTAYRTVFDYFSDESLETFSVQNNEIGPVFEIPNFVKTLNIQNNKIEDIYPFNNNLVKLQELNINGNLLNNNVFSKIHEISTLEKIELRHNVNLTSVTEDIGHLNNLEYLDLSNNENLKDLHSNLFVLNSLQYFNISSNPNLNPKIINFRNPVKICDFNNTTIDCYQPKTCENIEANEFTQCTKAQIRNVKSSQTIRDSTSLIIILIIIIIVAIPLAIILIYCLCIKNCHNEPKVNNSNHRIEPAHQYYYGSANAPSTFNGVAINVANDTTESNTMFPGNQKSNNFSPVIYPSSSVPYQPSAPAASDFGFVVPSSSNGNGPYNDDAHLPTYDEVIQNY